MGRARDGALSLLTRDIGEARKRHGRGTAHHSYMLLNLNSLIYLIIERHLECFNVEKVDTVGPHNLLMYGYITDYIYTVYVYF